MSKRPSEMRRRLPFLVAIVSLVPSAVQSAGDGQTTVAGLSMALALTNLVGLALGSRAPLTVDVWVHMGNAVLALFLAFQLHRAGAVGLPYAWLVAGAVFLVAAFLSHRRARRHRGSEQTGTSLDRDTAAELSSSLRDS